MLYTIPWYILCMLIPVTLYLFIRFKILFFLFLILGTVYFMLIWGNIFIYDFLHPRKDMGMGFVWGVFFLMMDTICFFGMVVITLFIDGWIKRKTEKQTLFYLIWQSIPFKKIFSIGWKLVLTGWILLQPYLIWSGYQAYQEAKRLEVKNFQQLGIFDFYTPFVKHIRVYLKDTEGKPYTDTYKRWSYRRGRFVYEYQ